MKERYDPFKKYGLKRVINAAASLTLIGGTVSDPRVFEAMEDVSTSFVSIPLLQVWAGDKIAKITGAEAGLPTAGASNGLTLATAACIMRGTVLENFDPVKDNSREWENLSRKLPFYSNEFRNEFVVQRKCRNAYDHSVELAGGRFVEVDSTEEALDDAYNSEKTAAYYFTARASRLGLTLQDVVKIAHSHDSLVIVDAAAENPPIMKLKYYIELGADLVSYSGGKHIRGPNNSGFIAGKADLIKLAHLQSYPFYGVGRGAKSSRETIIGLVKALEIYLEIDENAEFKEWLKKTEWFKEQFTYIPGVNVGVTYQRVVETGEPMAPFCYLIINENVCGVSGKELVEQLKDGDPSIYSLWEPAFLLGEDSLNKVVINPVYLQEGEHEIVAQRIKNLLQ